MGLVDTTTYRVETQMAAKDDASAVFRAVTSSADIATKAVDKLKIVTDYIQASSAARRRYLNSGAAYIDVFCGPGRSKIRIPVVFARMTVKKSRGVGCIDNRDS